MKKFLLGIRKEDNKRTYLIAPSWDCNWYWGFGYVQTFSGNYIYDHQHFDSLFLKKDIYDSYKNYFKESTLDDDEIWKLLGYMREFYIASKYAELLQYGNHITERAKCFLEEANKEANAKEVERINKKILPELFIKIEKLFENKT